MSEEIPPGLPPDAQRLDRHGLYVAEQHAAKLRPVILPMTLYQAGLHLNGLAVLEAAVKYQREFGTMTDCQEEQRKLLRDLPFGPLTREQYAINRRFLELEDLKP